MDAELDIVRRVQQKEKGEGVLVKELESEILLRGKDI